MGGTKLLWKPNKKTDIAFFATIFNTDEKEYFDVLGQYYINQLETDPSKEEYGDSIAVLGVGSFLNHARNRLNATIINIYHDGTHRFTTINSNNKRTENSIKWGLNYQKDYFSDVLSEWRMIDSAGYSLPQGNTNTIELHETIKAKINLNGERYTAYGQWNLFQSKIKKTMWFILIKKRK